MDTADRIEPAILETTNAYNKTFLPFFCSTNMALAPFNRFSRDEANLKHVRAAIDAFLDPQTITEQDSAKRDVKHTLDSAFDLPPVKRRRYNQHPTMKSVISRIEGTVINPIDLTEREPPGHLETPLEALRKIPVKFLKYAEDVRPPYIGTYTKIPVKISMAKLSRRPFTRALPAMNYDYDSEAEWEEPEEGEDLDSEGEEEADDDDADDMEGFLDDEDAEGPKRRHIMGDMQPVCTTLHWETESKAKGSLVVAYGANTLNLSNFRIESLLGKNYFVILKNET